MTVDKNLKSWQNLKESLTNSYVLNIENPSTRDCFLLYILKFDIIIWKVDTDLK